MPVARKRFRLRPSHAPVQEQSFFDPGAKLSQGYGCAAFALPATPAHPLAMFSVTQAEATAIRDAFHERGELSAVIELRRLFPGVTDHRQARECVRMIAGWGLSEPDQPKSDMDRDRGRVPGARIRSSREA